MAIREINTPRYETSDGKVFDNIVDAEAHQAGLDNGPVIEAFVKNEIDSERSQTTARRIIERYIAFAAAYVPEPVAEEAAEEEQEEEAEA